jgi:hypothetical protein
MSKGYTDAQRLDALACFSPSTVSALNGAGHALAMALAEIREQQLDPLATRESGADVLDDDRCQAFREVVDAAMWSARIEPGRPL